MVDLIEVHYEELAQVGTRFDDEAQRIVRVYRLLMYRLTGLKNGYWVGQNADQFYGVMDNEVLPALKRLIGALHEATETTHDIGELFYAAEEEAGAAFPTGAVSYYPEPTSFEGAGGGGIFTNPRPDVWEDEGGSGLPPSEGDVTTHANVEIWEDREGEGGSPSAKVEDWTLDQATVPPTDVDFNGDSLPLASGIPREDSEAQYEVLDGMDEEIRLDLPWGKATWNTKEGKWEFTWEEGIPIDKDFNSCGPVLASMILSEAFPGVVTAQEAFQRNAELIEEFWTDDIVGNEITLPRSQGAVPGDVSRAQYMNAVTATLESFGMEVEVLSSLRPADYDFSEANTFEDARAFTRETILDAVSENNVVATLVHINDDGLIGHGEGFGTGHFVAIDGVSADGEWVRIVNPFNNQHEYYPMEYVIDSMIGTGTDGGAAGYSNMAIVTMPED